MAATGRMLAAVLAAMAYPPRAQAGPQVFGSAKPLVGVYPTVPVAEYLSAYQRWVEQFGVATVVLPAEGDADEVFNRLWPLTQSLNTTGTVQMGRLNGMLIPGGNGPVAPLAHDLILRAVKANSEGKYWPVWGTCLGFEWMVQVFGGEDALQKGFSGTDLSADINLTECATRERILKFVNASVLGWLTHDNVTYEDHVSGVEPEHFMKSPGLPEKFDVLAITSDRNRRPYVAMIQGKHLPFYGVQFHPEKIRYVDNSPYMHNIPKTAEAQCVSDDLAEFFASEVQRGFDMDRARQPSLIV